MSAMLQSIIVQLRLFDEARVAARAVANRTIYTFTLDPYEYTLTRRDLREADGHDRVEVLHLLRTVRACELVQDWKCPEPTASEVQAAARRMLPPQRMP